MGVATETTAVLGAMAKMVAVAEMADVVMVRVIASARVVDAVGMVRVKTSERVVDAGMRKAEGRPIYSG